MLYVIDVEQSRLLSISPQLAINTRALSPAEMKGETPITELGETLGRIADDPAIALARSHVCHVGPWLFPRAACER